MAVNIDTDAEIDSIRLTEQEFAPEPDAGYSHIYAKADGLYIVDDDDVVTGPLVMAQDIGCKVYNNANISIANETVTELTFNSEVYDTDSIHDTGSNTGRLTCKTAGKYLVVYSWVWAATSTAFINEICKNGKAEGVTLVYYFDSAGKVQGNSLSCIVDLDVDDYVNAYAWQSSGDALNLLYGDAYSPYFSMQKIG